MELKEIINYVKESCDHAGISPDENTILDCSVRIFNSNSLKELKPMINPNSPTERQIEFMKRNKMQIPEGLTKHEASKLIDERIKAQREKQKEEDTTDYPDY